MIKRLRRKFIITNMIFVTAVIMAALVIMCISTYRRYYSDSMMAINQTLSMNLNDLKPSINFDEMNNNRPMEPPEKGIGRFSIFTVTLSKDSEAIESINDSSVHVSTETAEDAVNYALSSGKTSGTIGTMSLRFKISETDMGTKIAFADITNEKHNMQNLILISMLIFFSVLLIAFFISVFLSRRALQPVQDAWNQQRQFVADASHELKTPLTVILANLGILKTHPEHTIEGEMRWIQNTEEEAVRMKELLQDLLFLAKDDATAAPATPHVVLSLSQIVWECILPFESVVYEQKASMTEDIQDNLFISGDEKQLKQVLMILLDNACKYAGDGKIHVVLEQKREKAILRVQNTGTLIAKEDIDHIFERFYRASKSRSRNTGGYGLGLSIAQTIIQNHKGTVKVVSNEQTGTVFSVYFPIASQTSTVPR
ncbi:MAG: HAMP domain-containing sensor histidine kinase [Muricomes sp.]